MGRNCVRPPRAKRVKGGAAGKRRERTLEALEHGGTLRAFKGGPRGRCGLHPARVVSLSVSVAYSARAHASAIA